MVWPKVAQDEVEGVELTDSVKAQVNVTVSQDAPLGFENGVRMGPQRDQVTFWSEQDSRDKSVEPMTRRQNRPGQAKTKTFGEAEKGKESNLQAGERDSPFGKT